MKYKLGDYVIVSQRNCQMLSKIEGVRKFKLKDGYYYDYLIGGAYWQENEILKWIEYDSPLEFEKWCKENGYGVMDYGIEEAYKEYCDEFIF